MADYKITLTVTKEVADKIAAAFKEISNAKNKKAEEHFKKILTLKSTQF